MSLLHAFMVISVFIKISLLPMSQLKVKSNVNICDFCVFMSTFAKNVRALKVIDPLVSLDFFFPLLNFDFTKTFIRWRE